MNLCCADSGGGLTLTLQTTTQLNTCPLSTKQQLMEQLQNDVTVNANNLATATSPRILADFTFESIIVVVQQSVIKIVGRLYFVHFSLTLTLC